MRRRFRLRPPGSRWTTGNRLALGAVVSAAGACGVSALEAWRLGPLPAPIAWTAGAVDIPEASLVLGTKAISRIDSVVAEAPFRPDRRRPLARYRMPGEPVAAPPPVVRPTPRPSMVLAGVVVHPSAGSLAALAVPGQPARLVREGQEFHGFEVTRIRAGEVTLRSPDTTIVVRIRGNTPSPR